MGRPRVRIALGVVTALGTAVGIVGVSGAGTAAAQPASRTLKYTCKVPVIKNQPLTVKIDTGIPESVAVREPSRKFAIGARTTVDAGLTAKIRMIGVKTVEGTVAAEIGVSAPQGDRRIRVPLGIAKTSIPASGSLTVAATGAAPALTFSRPGHARITAGDIALHVVGKKAGGGVLGAADVRCRLERRAAEGRGVVRDHGAGEGRRLDHVRHLGHVRHFGYVRHFDHVGNLGHVRHVGHGTPRARRPRASRPSGPPSRPRAGRRVTPRPTGRTPVTWFCRSSAPLSRAPSPSASARGGRAGAAPPTAAEETPLQDPGIGILPAPRLPPFLACPRGRTPRPLARRHAHAQALTRRHPRRGVHGAPSPARRMPRNRPRGEPSAGAGPTVRARGPAGRASGRPDRLPGNVTPLQCLA